MVVPFVLFVFALVALIATLSVTEMVRVFAHRLSAVDTPGGRRIHRRPTARLGGLGIYWGFYVALALATYGHPFWSQRFPGQDPGLIGMMVGSSLLLIVGVMDDVYGLKATLKLAFQFGAALLLYGFGWRVETVGIPGIGVWALGPLALPVTVAWVVIVTNAVNLIDGLDGLASGLALIAALGMCAILAPSEEHLLLVAAALAGALLGFLWFNLNPALIFMGDAGSLFVGFILAAMTMKVGEVVGPGAFPVVPMLLLMVPLFDTGNAIMRRTFAAAREAHSPIGFLRDVRGRVFSPDGMHVHHRLVRAGLPTRRAVALLWGAAASFTFAACVVEHAAAAGAILVGILSVLWGRAFHGLRGRLAQSVPAAPVAVPPIPLTHADGPESSDPTRRAA